MWLFFVDSDLDILTGQVSPLFSQFLGPTCVCHTVLHPLGGLSFTICLLSSRIPTSVLATLSNIENVASFTSLLLIGNMVVFLHV